MLSFRLILYLLICGYLQKVLLARPSGADPENSEKGGQETCQLYSYYQYFVLESSSKIMQNFTEKRLASVHSVGP